MAERERRLVEREKLLKEREEQLLEQTENARAQYGDFLKNRTAFDADKAVFERQKVLWEREKTTLLQTARTQRVAVSAVDSVGGARGAVATNTAVGATAEAKDSPVSVISSEERLVSKMVSGAEEAVIGAKNSPNLSATDSGESSSVYHRTNT